MPDLLNLGQQITIAVSLAEGQFREFKSAYEGRPGAKVKRSVRSISKDIGEALVAFVNADGGELIIGVEDDGTLWPSQARRDDRKAPPRMPSSSPSRRCLLEKLQQR
jgi:hypothetical protein